MQILSVYLILLVISVGEYIEQSKKIFVTLSHIGSIVALEVTQVIYFWHDLFVLIRILAHEVFLNYQKGNQSYTDIREV